MHFYDFNAGVFGKTAPLISFVENDNEAKSAINYHYQRLLSSSIHNLFILETFQVYLTMSLLYVKVLRLLLTFSTNLTFYRQAN